MEISPVNGAAPSGDWGRSNSLYGGSIWVWRTGNHFDPVCRKLQRAMATSKRILPIGACLSNMPGFSSLHSSVPLLCATCRRSPYRRRHNVDAVCRFRPAKFGCAGISRPCWSANSLACFAQQYSHQSPLPASPDEVSSTRYAARVEHPRTWQAPVPQSRFACFSSAVIERILRSKCMSLSFLRTRPDPAQALSALFRLAGRRAE
jgi:hypothetical protein